MKLRTLLFAGSFLFLFLFIIIIFFLYGVCRAARKSEQKHCRFEASDVQDGTNYLVFT